MPDQAEGATIRSLHVAWNSGTGHSVPFTTVVSLKRRPKDYDPRLTNATAYALGDGLIALMGQAVVPGDFATSPFSARRTHDILSALGNDLLDRLDTRADSDLL